MAGIKNLGQYQWQWRFNENTKIWFLDLFREDIGVENQVPFLARSSDVAPHSVELKIISPAEPYARQYDLRKKSETETEIIFEKIFRSDYTGYVDSELRLIWQGGPDDAVRLYAEFFEGEFKTGFNQNGKLLRDIREFKEGLTQYIDIKAPGFGSYFPSFLKNSNLAEDVRLRVKEIYA